MKLTGRALIACFPLVMLVALLVLTGQWTGAPLPLSKTPHRVTVRQLDGERVLQSSGDAKLTLVGQWALTGDGQEFGGFSALVVPHRDRLILFSDRGWWLGIGTPDTTLEPVWWNRQPKPAEMKRWSFDTESATLDRESGQIWLSYEITNTIYRLPMLTGEADDAFAQPAAMADWPSNSGPESLLRLHDGRFIVLEEGQALWGIAPSEGLLFPKDPVEASKMEEADPNEAERVGPAKPSPKEGGQEAEQDLPVSFRFIPPANYRPTDMALLPDGRVLILLRSLHLPPPLFGARIVVADPSAIGRGGTWPWCPLVNFADQIRMDNYEGLAVAPAAKGEAVDLWMVSDDNRASFQQTLLVKIRLTLPSGPLCRLDQIDPKP
ncbi:esterase-like activity of phytase family protein [Altericroceibacterium endophyticum]|uniref:Phytase-like domain-containing protein n=1 Tax=Altericroceibacterium endophyticum TaxID=1808508 RepID=A0A6I4T5T8_9SPHN|nr:esterase-like activity of phytase family protein [Altericroceibacterium endophyticum]MXO65582.1 hypothetical protein [Altericroceibacterium endophyticum]